MYLVINMPVRKISNWNCRHGFVLHLLELSWWCFCTDWNLTCILVLSGLFLLVFHAPTGFVVIAYFALTGLFVVVFCTAWNLLACFGTNWTILTGVC
jgi:hypothetical protein